MTRCIPAVAANGSGVGRQSADVFGMPPPRRLAPPPAAARRRRCIAGEVMARRCRSRRGSRASPGPTRSTSGSSRSIAPFGGFGACGSSFCSGVPLSPPCGDVDRVGRLEEVRVRRAAPSSSIWRSGLMSSITQKPRPCVATIEIVAVDLEVAHRRHRQIELQRLPVVAVVERDERAALGAGEQQPAAHRDLPSRRARRRRRGRPLVIFCQRLAHVARAIDVRLEVLQLVSVDARVRGVRVEVRRLDRRHAAPRRERRRRHVLPASCRRRS